MVGEAIEDAIDEVLIGDAARRRAEAGKPRRPLPVIGEEAMDVGSGDPAGGRHGPVRAPVLEAREGPLRRGRALRPADVHFVAAERRAFGKGDAAHRRQPLVRRHDGGDLEEAQALDRIPRRALDAVRVVDAPPQHLVAAA
jgi:hypothetical protein